MREAMIKKTLVAFALVLGACAGPITPAQVQNAQNNQAVVARLCNQAMALAPIAGPYAIWITAGCASEELVANLALQPGAINYLNGLISKVRATAPTPLT
jgi:hypothetical protein